jgi:DHA2 family multidrug resistance protein
LAAASGLFNMLQNLGGAFGAALLAAIVTKREQFHSDVIKQLGNAASRRCSAAH